MFYLCSIHRSQGEWVGWRCGGGQSARRSIFDIVYQATPNGPDFAVAPARPAGPPVNFLYMGVVPQIRENSGLHS